MTSAVRTCEPTAPLGPRTDAGLRGLRSARSNRAKISASTLSVFIVDSAMRRTRRGFGRPERHVLEDLAVLVRHPCEADSVARSSCALKPREGLASPETSRRSAKRTVRTAVIAAVDRSWSAGAAAAGTCTARGTAGRCVVARACGGRVGGTRGVLELGLGSGVWGLGSPRGTSVALRSRVGMGASARGWCARRDPRGSRPSRTCQPVLRGLTVFGAPCGAQHGSRLGGPHSASQGALDHRSPARCRSAPDSPRTARQRLMGVP